MGLISSSGRVVNGLSGPIQFRGGAAVFDPSTLANLTWWLKADAGTNQSSGGAAAGNGDGVGEWRDQSASGLHVTQVTAGSKPTLRTNQFNGLPALQFDGGDNLSRTSVSMLSLAASTAVTFFIVEYINSADAVGSAWYTGSGIPRLGWRPANATDLFVDLGSAGDGRISVAVPSGFDDTLHLVDAYRSGASAELLHNGTLIGSTASVTTAFSTTNTLLVGSDTAQFMTGYLCEILCYARALSSTERGQVRTYLNARWGL